MKANKPSPKKSRETKQILEGDNFKNAKESDLIGLTRQELMSLAVKICKFSEIKYDFQNDINTCLLYTSPSPRDMRRSRMPSSA